jgi:hypothetical protein
MSSLPVAVEPVQCHIILPGREILVPPFAHTLAGFRAWAKSDDFPERGHISFIDQEIIIDMSPEELETHNHEVRAARSGGGTIVALLLPCGDSSGYSSAFRQGGLESRYG